MNKTKIEWADYTWNPIKGLCPVGCWYCYARKIYRRFKMGSKPFLDIAELNMTLKSKVTKARVFVCSTFELFSPVADTAYGRILYGSNWSWRDYIFDVIRRRPDLTFIILTKMPERIDRPMPSNVWLGVTDTTGAGDREDRIGVLCRDEIIAPMKFVSFEPMIGNVAARGFGNRFPEYVKKLSWVIVGRLTGYGHKYNDAPSRASVKRIVDICRATKTPVFLKNNLRDIWGPNLIQEFPK